MSTTNPQSEAVLNESGSADGNPARRARARRRSKHRRRLANVAGLMTALVLTGALYSVFAPAQAADETGESSAEAAGRELYERSCITCHGENLEGVPNRGPSLIGVGEAAVYFQVHTGRMPLVRQEADAPDKPAVFSDEEIDQLMAYVQANGGGPTLPSGDLRDGDLAEGGELFRLNCAWCHNFVGQGGALSSGKAAPSLQDSNDLEIYTAMLTGPENMPVFGDNQLTSEEKRAIVNYVQTISDQADPGGAGIGRAGPVAEGLVIWVVGIGALMFGIFWMGEQGVSTTRDTRPGSTGGADVPGPLYGGPDDDYTPEQLAAMSRLELDRLGARYDGVEILHVDPGPEPGSVLEKRAIRQVGLVWALAGLFAFLFVVVYVGSGWFLPDWQWSITEGGWSALFTPLLGLFMGLSLLLVGFGLVLFTKKLLPHETAVQDKHDGSHFDRVTAGATLVGGYHNSGLGRRKLITRSLALMGGGVGLMLIMPLGGLIKNPNKGNPLGTTSWAEGVRLVRDDGTPIRPGDQEPGSLETVFPAVPGGNRQADAATMLIRLRPAQVESLEPRERQEGFAYGEYVAYSKICTHAGCPVSLYEQETSRILCPCHQSQFDVTQGAKPVFGPATRALPQLPLDVDDEGYFIARSDYIEAVGPTYWNRERI